MTKQTALEQAEKAGVGMNAIYMRDLRQRRREVNEMIAFFKAWPDIWRRIKAGPCEPLPASCVRAAWLAWLAARQKKGKI